MHTLFLIDNIFVSDPSIFLSGLICLDISDHLLIFVALNSSNQPVVKDNMNVVLLALFIRLEVISLLNISLQLHGIL